MEETMRMSRKLILCLALVVSVAMATGGTLAYLTSTDSDVNTMTLGNVKIEQIEKERVNPTNGGNDALQDFSPNKPLYPAVGEHAWVEGSSGRVYQEWPTGGSSALFDTDKLQNELDKIVFVKNTGSSDAYVRTIFAFEAGNLTAETINNKLMHWNRNDTHWTWSDFSENMKMTLDGVTYYLREAVYTGSSTVHMNGVLPDGETTRPSLLQMFLDKTADNTLCASFGTTYDILVLSQAVQTAGFTDAAAALDEAFGDVTAANAATWFKGTTAGGNGGSGEGSGGSGDNEGGSAVGDDPAKTYDIPAGAIEVSNSDDLAAKVVDGGVYVLEEGTYHIPAVCKGKTLTLIGKDLNNTILEIVPAGQGEGNGQLDYNFDGSTVTFQNLTIRTNNQTYAGYARLAGTYKNVNFVNHYSLQRDSVFEYCTMNVTGDQYNFWTWGAPNVTFDHCTFNSDGKAAMLYGTADTKLTINNCLFTDTGDLPDLKAAIEIGNDYSKSYELIVNNTTVNGYEINNTGINTGTTLWANKNSMGTDKLNVVVDGQEVY